MQNAHQAQMAPVKKKGMSGCLMAFLIVGGIVVVIGIVVTVLVVRFFNSADGQRVIGAVKEGAHAVQDAQHAPGTTELKALGCNTPMVMDIDKLAQSMGEFWDAGTVPAEKKGQIGLVVTCPAGVSKKPSCDDVATTYVKAVGGAAAKKFSAEVTNVGGSSACKKTYNADGTALGTAKTE